MHNKSIKIRHNSNLKRKMRKRNNTSPIPKFSIQRPYIIQRKISYYYKIENDHTIILVKKHSASQPTTTENKTNTQSTTTNNNTSSNNINNNNNNNSNNNNNNQNPFMGLGGQMPDLSQLGSLMGNIDPNMLNNMM